MAGAFIKYRVILSGNILPEHDRQQVLQGLAEVFNSRPGKMEKLLQGKPVPLKKEYSEDQAQKICEKLRNVGVECRSEKIPEVEIALADDDTLHPSQFLDDLENKRTGKDTSGRIDHEHIQDNSLNVELGRNKLIELVMQFVATNKEYYRHQFDRFGNPRSPRFRISWHWPAFFFFFFWALYRKLWLYAALYVVGAMGIAILIQPPDLLLLIWVFIWPIIINYLYYRTAVQQSKLALRHPAKERQYLNKGGVSKAALGIGIVAVLVSSVFTSNFLTTRFLEKYGHHLEDVLPGAGTQRRGDGSVAKIDSDQNNRLSKTSLRLSIHATSLKIILVSEDSDARSQQLRKFIEKFNGGQVPDAWGKPILIEDQVDKYMLISAGPDKAYETDDDLLQPVSRN